MKTPILETENLILRPISLDDAPAVQKYFNDWDIIKYISNAPWPYPEDAALTFIRDTILPAMEHGEMCVWAITVKESDEGAIGMINYRFVVRDNQDNRGFWLARRHHGQGYMTEAAACVNEYIFETIGVERIRTRNVKGNIGSRRIKEKTGGVVVDEIVEIMAHGKEEIMEVWEITQSDWRAAKARLKL
jgi:ribosomal-protein-alanine N-acetyltransferase